MPDVRHLPHVRPSATVSDYRKKPTRAALAAFSSAVKEFSIDGLLDLRNRVAADREHPVVIRAIDCELLRRGDN
jgi:hypothetical protein